MKPYSKIQALGYEAYREGVPKNKNPFQYCSLRNNGAQKAAAWSTGWEKAKEAGKHYPEDPVLDDESGDDV